MYNYYYSDPTLTNCTFTNNTANNVDGGGMATVTSIAATFQALIDTTVCGNTPDQIYSD